MTWTKRSAVIDPLERFLSYVTEDETGYTSSCWVWNGRVNAGGYGVFSTGYRKPHSQALAHRWLYEEMVGPPPADLTDLDHLCLVKTCVRPEHLEPVTRSENSTRKVGRVYKNRGRPLSPEHVEAIRRARALAPSRGIA